MRVYIFTEAGSQYGYGHITRCSSIYNELVNRQVEVRLIINGDDKVEEVVKEKKYTIINWLSDDYLTSLLTNDDFAIVDSYLADEDIYQSIARLSKRALFIDDNMRLDYPKGIVVNPSLYGKELNYPSNKDTEFLLGPEFVLLREAFLRNSNKHIHSNVNEVLVTLGGADVRNLTPKVLQLLRDNYPTIIKNVVIGKGFTNVDEIESIDDPRIKLFYNVDENRMKELMVQSGFAITAAGQTIHELIKTETPFIPIKVIDNQKNNAKALIRYNLVNSVLDSDDQELFHLLSQEIEYIMNYNNRINLVNNLSGIIDGLGSSRIVSNLVKE